MISFWAKWGTMSLKITKNAWHFFSWMCQNQSSPNRCCSLICHNMLQSNCYHASDFVDFWKLFITTSTNQHVIIISQWAITKHIFSIAMCSDVTQLFAGKQSSEVMLNWWHLCCYILQKHKTYRMRVKNIHYRNIFCGDSIQSFTLPQSSYKYPMDAPVLCVPLWLTGMLLSLYSDFFSSLLSSFCVF